jgi:predicted ester cyclase
MLSATSSTPDQAATTAEAPIASAGHSQRATRGPRDTVLAFYDAFDHGALGRFEGIAPGFEARVFGGTVLDWPGFLGFATAFREAFPKGRHVFDHVVTEGDKVATIGRYRGRHERPFMGVPATGREVDFVVMHVDVVAEGRIVEHRGIGDAATMWAQLGVSPPASA